MKRGARLSEGVGRAIRVRITPAANSEPTGPTIAVALLP
jgi:hypothetical protein